MHAPRPLPEVDLRTIHRFWCAANYLTVGQIYLQANPLLRQPLTAEHIKPRLLGHWGTSPGLSFIYAHLNRLIVERDANVLYLAGPGHGGPALLANVYLEGTYSEVYPQVSRDEAGLTRLFRQFSTPGGVPSHVSVPTPGSIHEGGELGYVLVHAFGAAFDNPDLLAVAVVGDGEAETAPLEGSWKGVHFLNPARDGAVLPILHLNGYKISGPTVLGRRSNDEVAAFLRAQGYEPWVVDCAEPMAAHAWFAETLDACHDRILEIQRQARRDGVAVRPRWPAIVLRTPKGWTGPKSVDGLATEGSFRSHQVPLARVREEPEQLRALESWLASYHPDELFDRDGRLLPELASITPRGARRMGANPHANGGALTKALVLPCLDELALDVPAPAATVAESTRPLGKMLARIFTLNAGAGNFRLFCPDETNSNRLGDVFAVESRCAVGGLLPDDDHLSPAGRVMEVLSEHLCEGWLEGYTLTGRHGLFATYEAFAMVAASMIIQHAKWLEGAASVRWRAPIPSLNILLTSTCWRNDHNGFSHQGPGLIDTVLALRGAVTRLYFPPDANCLLAVAEHCLSSRAYVNLIVIDKQAQRQWHDLASAKRHCAAGAGEFAWAGNTPAGDAPDVVLAAAGDVPTLEAVAAAQLLRRLAPSLRTRVVNVVDLMTLAAAGEHPHAMSDARFAALFTADRPVIFAFHGYPRAVHALVHGRPRADRFHVRGYREEGTTTTPFDMVVRNGMSRYHLCIEALRRAGAAEAGAAIAACQEALARHEAYIREHFEDLPEVRGWAWEPRS